MKILIAGDYCPQNRILNLIQNKEYSYIFPGIKDIIQECDLSIVNLEAPILNEKTSPIDKCGPNLQCPQEAIEALNYIGFNLVTLANNHIYDYGEKGLISTLETLNKQHINYVGGGRNIKEASTTFYKEIKNECIAIINCCEHEFSIATHSTGGAHPLDPINLYNKIKEARKKADFVLVIIHGGHELYQLPSPRMVETYHFLIDVGADAIVNHHQHCFSGYELYKGKPIYYGLGNFCFDNKQTNSIWNEGYMLQIVFQKGLIKTQIIPYTQCAEEPCIKLLPPAYYDNKINELNKIITNKTLLFQETNKYYHSSINKIYNILNPIQNKYLRKLQNRKLFPSFICNKWLIILENYILCESHKDKLEFFFRNRNKHSN